MKAHYRTVDMMQKEVAVGELKASKGVDKLFHFCQSEFGCCVGSARPEDCNRVWVFSRCIKNETPAQCNILITNVWLER